MAGCASPRSRKLDLGHPRLVVSRAIAVIVFTELHVFLSVLFCCSFAPG